MVSTNEMIPLFPLDVVLFPGMVLPLNIFEPRYRKMVRDCLTNGKPFGLIWAESEPIKLSSDQPLIGTKAMMTSVNPQPDGRFHINTVGSERFLVRRLYNHEPYLMGDIEPYPSLERNSREAHQYVPQLSQLFDSYLKLLSQAAEQRVSISPMPTEPATLAFVVAILYQGQNWRKQELLAIDSVPELMRQEIKLLRIENPLIEQTLELLHQRMLPPLMAGYLATYSLN